MSRVSQQFSHKGKGNLRAPGGRTGRGTAAENEEKQQHPRSAKTEGRSRGTPEECKAFSKWYETTDTSEGAANRGSMPGDETQAASSKYRKKVMERSYTVQRGLEATTAARFPTKGRRL
ncbi:hypothetical protein TGRUB_313025 [Toxoplasma gondii RUB]|uniref:Uncharacterized protein n=3 Tax=Toxoplasma gondii TaxID=5811 RepID=A0A086MAZ9_TOXGO|nr:hypothetical protein TGP89_313025 [Toxoplasma gondii p89]KFG66067.1 hypothetical protein TGRUB_313025 [Toxoplasma gondii RUB]KFH09744.1 hypothetical protein TGVAND_313025 [Toxoplasma gondii VAND]